MPFLWSIEMTCQAFLLVVKYLIIALAPTVLQDSFWIFLYGNA